MLGEGGYSIELKGGLPEVSGQAIAVAAEQAKEGRFAALHACSCALSCFIGHREAPTGGVPNGNFSMISSAWPAAACPCLGILFPGVRLPIVKASLDMCSPSDFVEAVCAPSKILNRSPLSRM